MLFNSCHFFIIFLFHEIKRNDEERLAIKQTINVRLSELSKVFLKSVGETRHDFRIHVIS